MLRNVDVHKRLQTVYEQAVGFTALLVGVKLKTVRNIHRRLLMYINLQTKHRHITCNLTRNVYMSSTYIHKYINTYIYAAYIRTYIHT
jgi:hypothetical protein